MSAFPVLLTLAALCTEPLSVGDHSRSLMVGTQQRSYLVHVPKGLDLSRPVPVVLALHGAAMNGSMMVWFSGLNRTADTAGFIVVYPNGSGVAPFLTWNAGGMRPEAGATRPDDVAFISKLLDDLASVSKIDPQRVFACGMSNGGMMCYRLAAELSDRIAAIAPVAGTLTIDDPQPKRPVPLIHFHGTQDNIVPYEFIPGKLPRYFHLKGVEESIRIWVKLNACEDKPATDILSNGDDDLKVTRRTYREGRDKSEVVLVVIEGGGHTWPGQTPPIGYLGRSSNSVSANEVMWKFFQKHPLPPK